MRFLFRHWYNIGLILGILAGIYLIFAWNDLSTLQILIALNFIAFMIHQFEEYSFPGGFPTIVNLVWKKSDVPDRYPLNQSSSFLLNVCIGYPMYIIPFFFPETIWLGLAGVIAGIMQLGQHGIVFNKMLKSFYNPGLFAVVFLHVPIGIYYIYEIHTTGVVTIWDWIIAFTINIVVFLGIAAQVIYKVLPDKNSPYPFAEVEMKKFNVEEKLKRKGLL